jgi:hypothetical protein
MAAGGLYMTDASAIIWGQCLKNAMAEIAEAVAIDGPTWLNALFLNKSAEGANIDD